jgi:NADPH:quinone reductase
MKAIGLNYADVYRRKGNYHLKGVLLFIAGYEGIDVVINTNNVNEFKNGDRIYLADRPYANAALAAVPVDHAIPFTNNINSKFKSLGQIILILYNF